MIETAGQISDFVFHWCGVWLVMNAITRAGKAVMRWHEEYKERRVLREVSDIVKNVDSAIRQLDVAEKGNDTGENTKQDAEKGAGGENDSKDDEDAEMPF